MATQNPNKDLRASIPISKPIVYLDMDGVLCDFDARHDELLARGISKEEAFDHPEAYLDLKPIPGAIEAYHKLQEMYEVYILSTASWDNLTSWKEKRVWVEDYLGESAKKKLILSHNKGLLRGDYLVDDRIANGVSDFKGEHIHFGSKKYPDWNSVMEYLNSMPLRLSDAHFLYSLMPEWIKEQPANLSPMSYGTLTRKGDIKIALKVRKILFGKNVI